jgi:nitrogen-specific signal transduction histidine kinase
MEATQLEADPTTNSSKSISNQTPLINGKEESIRTPEIKIISDVMEIANTFLYAISQAAYEIKIVFPTMNAFHRAESIGVIDAIESLASREHLEARILSPLDLSILERAGENHWHVADNKGLTRFLDDGSSERKIILREVDMKRTETNVTIVIVDGERSLVFELKDDSTLEFGKAVGLGTYSTSPPTVASYVAFFEKLWDEMDLSEREARSRKQAELLQDILTHDIRNYIQVSLIAAELIQDRLKEDHDFDGVTTVLLDAVNGATQLVSKAQRLGRIIAEGRPKLYPIDLLESIDRSLALVKSAYPSKVIRETVKFKRSKDRIKILADDLLDEVFINIIGNSVKHSSDTRVGIDISASAILGPDGKEYCSVSISDHGKGIADEQKLTIFERYSKTKKGNGLGMSIAHALVVGRYDGKLSVRDNSPTGAVFEVTLPASYPA